MNSPTEDDIYANIGPIDPNLHNKLRQMQLTKSDRIAEGVAFSDRPPPHDTTDFDLQGGQFIMFKSTRELLEKVVFILNIFMLFTGYVDYYHIEDIAQRVEPYDMIIGIDVKHINATASDLKAIPLTKVRTFLYFIGVAYALANIFRLFLQYKVFGQEENGYYKKRDSMYITIQYWISQFIFVWLLVYVHFASSALHSASTNSGQILKEKMSVYASGTYPGLKQAIDRFQMNYECCGSGSLTTWYDVDLYQLEANFSHLGPKMQAYLTSKYSCHYNIPRGSAANIQIMNTFIDAHKGNKANKSLTRGLNISHYPTIYKIKSLPFSCCNISSGLPCPFFNHANQDKYWKGDDIESFKREAIYTKTCDDVVKEKLIQVGVGIELTNAVRILVEAVVIVVLGIVLHSFQTEYELNYVPSVSSVSFAWLFAGAIVCVVYYYWAIHFINNSELVSKYFSD